MALLIQVGANAQLSSKLYMGFDLTFATDNYRIEDPGGHLVKGQLSSAVYGMTFRYMADKHSFVETGLYRRMHREGIYFHKDYGATGTGRWSFMIPLRFGMTIPVVKNVRISPVAGFVLGISKNEDYEVWGEGNTKISDAEEYSWRYDIDYPTDVYTLLQAGLSIDVRVFNNCMLRFTTSYYAGLQELYVQDTRYTAKNGPQVQAKIINKGSFLAAPGIGFSFPVGDWKQ